jgi:hypothetical protein
LFFAVAGFASLPDRFGAAPTFAPADEPIFQALNPRGHPPDVGLRPVLTETVSALRPREIVQEHSGALQVYMVAGRLPIGRRTPVVFHRAFRQWLS